MTSGLAGAGASMGSPLLLNIVGAVVLGGTSLSGGRGSLLRTGIGVLFLGFLSNGMSLLGCKITTSRWSLVRSFFWPPTRTGYFVGGDSDLPRKAYLPYRLASSERHDRRMKGSVLA